MNSFVRNAAALLPSLATVVAFAAQVPARAQSRFRSEDPFELQRRLDDLKARLYLANDPTSGSLLRAFPEFRHDFGFPGPGVPSARFEDIDRTETEREFAAHAMSKTTDLVLEFAPSPIVLGWEALQLADEAKSLRESRGDGRPLENIILLQAEAALFSYELGLAGTMSLMAPAVGQAIALWELKRTLEDTLRSRFDHRRALGLVRPPVPSASRDLTIRGATRADSGWFQATGTRYSASGNWGRKEGGYWARARYEYRGFEVGGALVDGTGSVWTMEERGRANSSSGPLDWILNTIGRGSNWIGRNRSGGKIATQTDEYGQFPLGATDTESRSIFDHHARLHDIEYWVSSHFPKGAEVVIRGPRGDEFYTSEGGVGAANLRVVLRSVSVLATPWKLFRFDQRDGVRTTSRSGGAVTIDDRGAMRSPPPVGTVRTTRRVERTRVRVSGEAFNRAWAEYERTGVYDLERHMGDSPSGAPSVVDSPRPPANRRGDPSDAVRREIGAPHDVKRDVLPGGVRFEPELVITLDRSGRAQALARAAEKAFDGERDQVEIEVDGRKYRVARRSGSATTLPPSVAASAAMGGYRGVQVDLIVGSGPLPAALVRFYASRDTRPSALGPGWSVVPFELDRSVGDVVLLDRETGMRLAWQDATTSHQPVRLLPRGVGPHPDLRRQADGSYAARFADGLVARFDASGRLTRYEVSSDAVVGFEYAGDRLSGIRCADGSIELGYDSAGALMSARASDGRVVSYHYDAVGHLVGVRAEGGGRLDFDVDDGGRLLQIHGAKSRESTAELLVANQYDALGRMTRHARGGRSWEFHYADAERRLDLIDDAGERLVLFHDADDRVLAYGPRPDALVVVSRDPDGLIREVGRAALLGVEPDGGLRLRIGRTVAPRLPR